jgi:hypothetical protein
LPLKTSPFSLSILRIFTSYRWLGLLASTTTIELPSSGYWLRNLYSKQVYVMRSKLASSPSVQILNTLFRPGNVIFSFSSENFMVRRCWNSTSLYTKPRAGCFWHVAMLVPIAYVSISQCAFSISLIDSSLRSLDARTFRSMGNGNLLFQTYLHFLHYLKNTLHSFLDLLSLICSQSCLCLLQLMLHKDL